MHLHALLAAFLLLSIAYRASGIPHKRIDCPICEDEDGCNDDLEPICAYGKTIDYCGRIVCKKGQGEHCGGKQNKNGICAPGLMCSCNRCVGCPENDLGQCLLVDHMCQRHLN